MPNVPIIQNISPSHVAKILITKPYGTYIIRRRTLNDDIISSIEINNKLLNNDNYVVLSVRVDEILYSSSVMNYRLLLINDNTIKLLDEYSQQRKIWKNLPKLKYEWIITNKDYDWNLDLKEFNHINFDTSNFGGKNNSDLSEAIWQKRNQDQIKVFIKRFHKTNLFFQNELNILQQISFFPIITLYGYYSNRNYNYLIFEYGGQSLQSICPIQSQADESQMYRIVKIAFQICNAMIYLEKKKIIHRDLTADNILIDRQGFIHIIDFGHAILKEDGKNNLSRTLTHDGRDRFQVRFLAPECLPNIITSNQQQFYASFSSKSDVWAFGILIIQLMLPKPSKPYPDIKNDRDITQYIKIDRNMHPKPDDCILDVYYILQQCWAYEPINRISFTDLQLKLKILLLILR